MYKPSKDMTGGANSSYDGASGKNSIGKNHPDDVGLGAGEKFASGSPDAKGTDRGFADKRDDLMGLNPQNQHEVVNPEYTRNVAYGGQTKFSDEP